MEYIIDQMQSSDWEKVRAIYVEGIKNGNSTFETDAPTWEKWDATHLQKPRLVARAQGNILGFISLAPVSGRVVYSGVAEVSLYVSSQYRKLGIGSALMSSLIAASEKAGIWTLQGSIFPENVANIALVKKHGFREIGRREKIARMTYGDFKGTWRDTVSVERRSKVVGLD
jgi:phosphinothricin acetyltransferase